MPNPWEMTWDPSSAQTQQDQKPWEMNWNSPSSSSSSQPGLLDSVYGIGKSLLKTGASIGGDALNKIDSYTGAPGRAAAMTLEKEGVSGQGLLDAAHSFKNQFGADTASAPSASDVRKGLGIPDMPAADVLSQSPYGPMKAAGYAMKAFGPKMDLGDLATSVATDPTSYIPLGLLADATGKAGSAAKGLLSGTKDAAEIADEAKPVAGSVGATLDGLHDNSVFDWSTRDEMGQGKPQTTSEPMAVESGPVNDRVELAKQIASQLIPSKFKIPYQLAKKGAKAISNISPQDVELAGKGLLNTYRSSE
jgi:hypothetical protein